MEDDKKQPMTRKEIIKEISDVTNMKQEIVKSILDSFADIFIRESVMTGKFNFSNCFTVKTITRPARRQYNVYKDKYEQYPETDVLNITLSKKIHYFNRWKQRHEYNEKHGLTIEDWQNRENEELPK